ncbi:MAG: electron transfer flavoprotein subunit alpha/FixB family protein [Bernardetiaceae bacterium]
MSILVYIESDQKTIKKSSLEVLAYAAQIAEGKPVTACITLEADADALAQLGQYGVSKVLQVSDERLFAGPVAPTATAIAQAAEAVDASLVLMARSALVDAAAPRVGIKLNAVVISNVTSLPEMEGESLTVQRGVYTGKAFAQVKATGAKKVLTLTKNILQPQPNTDAAPAAIEAFAVTFGGRDFDIAVTEVKKQEGDILLPEAERVVSAGRGLKGPENWQMIEDLAKTLGAATACSKPVSDLDWRPHHEHVGQTGIKVSPGLYIAVGISGAIQHLAGVNSSKTIVVINKDPEAPFFKSADYGIVGDAFDIIPKLNEAIKKVI